MLQAQIFQATSRAGAARNIGVKGLCGVISSSTGAMSSAYNVEPNPTAKVILKTTAGDLLLELFAKQTPLTSRNFLQLCLDGYYNNTIFHRLVPGFIIQGGDPTGTGSGGQSSYESGASFADEFHSRLRFNRRGLLGMANSGTKNDNASQFFLTLGKTEELNGRNTMFGRIEGNTIYNLVKMGEAELMEGEGSERPMYPTRIIGIEILVNPFDDMVKRSRHAQPETSSKLVPKTKARRKKGKQMLSFGAEECEGDIDSAPISRPKFNPKFAQTDDSMEKPSAASITKKVPDVASEEPSKLAPQIPETSIAPADSASISQTMGSASESLSPSPEPEPEPDRQAAKLAKTNAQIENLKQSLKRENPVTAESTSKRPKSVLESLMPASARRGVKFKASSKADQRDLDAFSAFQNRIKTAGNEPPRATKVNGAAKNEGLNGDSPAPKESTTADDNEDVCDLHFVPNCQSCKKWDEAEENSEHDDVSAEGLIRHKLSFAKDRLGKDLEWKRQNEKELVVIDPRERERELLGSKRSKMRMNH